MNKIPSFKNYIQESVIDIPRNTLDPTVFSFPENELPILQTAIKEQIVRDINRLNNVFPIKKFYIIGSILTKRYTDKSDIDINVEIESMGDDKDMISTDTILKTLKDFNGKLATGTTYPINYYITRYEYDLDKTDAAYDVMTDKWLKIPENEDDHDLTEYMEQFQEAVSKMDILTGELRRNILDIDYYKKIPTNKVEKLKSLIESKLKDIEDDIVNLSNSKKELSDLRKFAFTKDIPFKEIRKYISRNWLPENVVYKLFSKYQYNNFVKRLEDFLEGNKPIDVNDVNTIRKIGRRLW